MKTKQYEVIEIKSGKSMGYIIGKTPERELVLKQGNRTYRLKITPATESKYRVDVIEFSA